MSQLIEHMEHHPMKDVATPITCHTFLPDAVFDALVAKLVCLVQEPFEVAGTDARTEVVTALGEVGGVWPQAVHEWKGGLGL